MLKCNSLFISFTCWRKCNIKITQLDGLIVTFAEGEMVNSLLPVVTEEIVNGTAHYL